MQVSNPIPLSFAFFSLLLPGVLVLAWALARGALGDRQSARVVTPGLALAVWLGLMHAVSYMSGSFLTGLKASTTTLGLCGYAMIAFCLCQRGKIFPQTLRNDSVSACSTTPQPFRFRALTLRLWSGQVVNKGPGQPEPSVCEAERFRSLHGASARKSGDGRASWLYHLLPPLLATVLIAPMALGWAFHDEMFFTGHMSIASQILNDAYPPHHLTFPAVELRYHYGFSLLCAALSAVVRLPVESAIDISTLALWFYSWCLLRLLGDRLIAQGWGNVAAAVVLFGGGMEFFSAPEDAPFVWNLLGLGIIDSAILNPPVVSYFFQHPWTVGLPIGLCLIALAEREAVGTSAGSHSRASLAIAVFFLVQSLAICQAVLFASLGAAVLAARRLKDGWALPVAILLAGAVSFKLGGMFAPYPGEAGSELVTRVGVAETLTGTLLWHVQTFGFMIPFGIAGFFLLKRRLLFGLLLVGSLCVFNLLRHVHSWDIVKFAVLSSIVLSFIGTATLRHIWNWARSTLLKWVVTALAFTALTAGGIAFPVVFALDLPGIPETLYHRSSQTLSVDDVKAVEWLRSHVSQGELVYRRFPMASGYAQSGGLPQVWVDRMAERHGFSPTRIRRRLALLHTLPDQAESYLAEGIRWFVLDPDDLVLNRHAARWIAAGQAEVTAMFGHLTILRLREVPVPTNGV